MILQRIRSLPMFTLDMQIAVLILSVLITSLTILSEINN